jgi:hypothetical protein
MGYIGLQQAERITILITGTVTILITVLIAGTAAVLIARLITGTVAILITVLIAGAVAILIAGVVTCSVTCTVPDRSNGINRFLHDGQIVVAGCGIRSGNYGSRIFNNGGVVIG